MRAVFDWYRQRLTRTTFRPGAVVVVPSTLAGWVLPGPGERADADGVRPLGAVKELLDGLVADAPLDVQQRVAVRAAFGLSGWPAERGGRPLGRRVPAQRLRGRPGIERRRLHAIVASAFEILDGQHVLRPADVEVPAGLVPDPANASWLQASQGERLAIFDRMIEDALSFASVSGAGGDAERLLVELRAYQAAHEANGWEPRNRPFGTSRARAVASVALWARTRPGTPVLVLEPAATGAACPPDGLVSSDPWVGRLLAGDRTSTVIEHAAQVARAAAESDRSTAATVTDLLLGGDPANRHRLGPSAAATILRTAVRVRAVDEDPTVLGLARYALHHYPTHWQTVDALQTAVRVASAYRQYRLALELCALADRAAADPELVVLAGRDRRLERDEFRLWTLHQRTATLRRALETGTSDRTLAALRLADQAQSELDRILDQRTRGAPGDAQPVWAYYFHLRRGELHHLAGLHQPGHLAASRAAANEAAAVASHHGFSDTQRVPLVKLRLTDAIVHRELDEAVDRLWQLHRTGWPVGRILPNLTPALEHRFGRPPTEITSALEQIADTERAPGWNPIADARAGRVQRRSR